LGEDGINLYGDLIEERFKEKITKEYEYVNKIYQGNMNICLKFI
jgi:hypothetical protein